MTDATGEIPAIGEVEDLDKLDMVGVKDGGGGGVSGEIIVDVLEPKCDVIDDVGTFKKVIIMMSIDCKKTIRLISCYGLIVYE